MIDQITTAYITALFLICAGYVSGYIVGRLDLIYSAMRLLTGAVVDAVREPASSVTTTMANSRRFSVAPSVATKPLDINEAVYVSPISTAGMERNASVALGKTTAVQDDIGASVSKLSQLKGK